MTESVSATRVTIPVESQALGKLPINLQLYLHVNNFNVPAVFCVWGGGRDREVGEYRIMGRVAVKADGGERES